MAEWEAGVDFLLRAGQISHDPKKRHEWMFLSDTLGVTMLVDCINHRHSVEAMRSAAEADKTAGEMPTEWTVQGPVGCTVGRRTGHNFPR